MLKVLIAIDSFKGALSSKEAGIAISQGFHTQPNIETTVLPVSDGGEGSLEAMYEVVGGEMQYYDVQDIS